MITDDLVQHFDNICNFDGRDRYLTNFNDALKQFMKKKKVTIEKLADREKFFIKGNN